MLSHDRSMRTGRARGRSGLESTHYPRARLRSLPLASMSRKNHHHQTRFSITVCITARKSSFECSLIEMPSSSGPASGACFAISSTRVRA